MCHKPPEVRLAADGSVDRIKAHGASVHLERISPSHWWCEIERNGRSVRVHLTTKRRIDADFREEWKAKDVGVAMQKTPA